MHIVGIVKLLCSILKKIKSNEKLEFRYWYQAFVQFEEAIHTSLKQIQTISYDSKMGQMI